VSAWRASPIAGARGVDAEGGAREHAGEVGRRARKLDAPARSRVPRTPRSPAAAIAGKTTPHGWSATLTCTAAARPGEDGDEEREADGAPPRPAADAPRRAWAAPSVLSCTQRAPCMTSAASAVSHRHGYQSRMPASGPTAESVQAAREPALRVSGTPAPRSRAPRRRKTTRSRLESEKTTSQTGVQRDCRRGCGTRSRFPGSREGQRRS